MSTWAGSTSTRTVPDPQRSRRSRPQSFIRRTLLASLAVGPLVVGLPLPAAAGSPSAPTDLVRLESTALTGLVDIGRLPAAKPMQLMVVLSDPHVAAEKALLAAQSAGRAAPLTPHQWAARFALAKATYLRARAFATAHGLTVTNVSATRTMFTLTGTAAQVERTLDVSLRRYLLDGAERYATREGPLVPVAAGIEAVLGLDDFTSYQSDARFVPIGASPSSRPAAQSQLASIPPIPPTSNPKPTPTKLCFPGPAGLKTYCSFTINEVARAYEMPARYTGQGQRVAVFGFGRTDTVIADLHQFETTFHRPRVPARVVNVGNNPQTNDSLREEWDLDTQAATGLATGVRQLVLYFAANLSDTSVVSMFSTWANDPAGPAQANASFGTCAPTPAIKTSMSVGTYLAMNSVLRQARGEGRTLFAAAGDQGGACNAFGLPNYMENGVFPQIEVPAGSPNAVSVGGTSLQINPSTGRRLREGAANAGGGGSSDSIPADPMQQGITVDPLVYPTGHLPACLRTLDGTGAPAPLCRSVPDVSALCGNIGTGIGVSGLIIVVKGQYVASVGTSLSSPLTMGMWTVVQSSSQSGNFGFANDVFYKYGKQFEGNAGSPPGTAAPLPSSNHQVPGSPFYDIQIDPLVGETNGNVQHFEAPGYDQSTGWGVLRPAVMIRLLI